MKILRLSIFNIKKNKRDAFILVVLISISILMMGVALANIRKADGIFNSVVKNTECRKCVISFFEKDFKTEYLDIIESDDKIENINVTEMLVAASNVSSAYRNAHGETVNLYVSMITEYNEKKFEKFSPETPFTEQEIEETEHPIWMPYFVKYNLGYKAGDEIVLIIGGRDYPFRIVGFYDTCIYGGNTYSLKCVISDKDYAVLDGILVRNILVSFDTKDGIINNYSDAQKFDEEFANRFEDMTGKNPFTTYQFRDIEYVKDSQAGTIKIIMICILFISAIVTISSVLMIRHKITVDIDRQMQSIGVLEALGYRSREISKVYIYEYLILGLIGSIIGTGLVIISEPFMTHVIETMIGHAGAVHLEISSIVIPAITIIVLIEIAALFRAGCIKKYPPVVAFRKGITTHHFGKNFLPMEKMKKRVNLRIGIRNISGNMRQNIGIFICVFMAGVAISFCMFIADIFRNEGKGFNSISGWEISDLYLTFDRVGDDLRYELESMDEVRKCVFHYDTMVRSGEKMQMMAHDDYSELENLYVQEGRFPEHDNEVLICNAIAARQNLNVGDSMIIEGRGVEKDYVVVGITNNLNSNIVYVTTDGMRRIEPIYGGGIVMIYLEEGTDVEAFKEKIKAIYGTSREEALSGSYETGSYEERIKAKAEEQMALMMSNYGADNVSYAIKIGDKVILGNSGKFKLDSITSYDEILGTQLGGISRISNIFAKGLAVVVALIVAIILNFLIGSTIRNKRREFGIEKALGYTSRDLKLQMIWRILPIAVPAMVIGSIAAIPLMKLFADMAFGGAGLETRYILLIPLNIIMILYLFGTSYISAGKIRSISVTELMTE